MAAVVAWLKRGNPLARAGIVILFFGAAFLAKYAADHSMFPIELRFVARLFWGLESEPAPSRIGLADLQDGLFDTAVEAPMALRHRTYEPADTAGALRVAWPPGGGLAQRRFDAGFRPQPA